LPWRRRRECVGRRPIDGFWANATSAEVAVRRGIGTIVLDVRRGDGPSASLPLHHAWIRDRDRKLQRMRISGGAVRAIVETQKRSDGTCILQGEVGRKLFPSEKPAVILDVVERDLPYLTRQSPSRVAASTVSHEGRPA